MNPHNVRNAEFKTVRKGLDRDEVNQFLAEVADSLEKAQNHATAMEARARAAVQRVQELAATQSEVPAAESEESPVAVPEEAETISRALLLAQRTADTAVAEAEAEAQSVRATAAEEAAKELDAARELAKQMTETAKADAEKMFADEKASAVVQIAELTQNRELLAADVDALDAFLAAQRERIRDAASTLLDLADRAPGGLAEMAAPILDSRAAEDTAEIPAPPDDAPEELVADDEPIEDAPAEEAPNEPDEAEEPVDAEPEASSEPETPADDATRVLDAVDRADEAVPGDPADATPVGSPDDLLIVTDLSDRSGDGPAEPAPPTDDLRFKFTDER